MATSQARVFIPLLYQDYIVYTAYSAAKTLVQAGRVSLSLMPSHAGEDRG